MPLQEVSLPLFINMLIIAGMVAAAVTGIAVFVARTKRGIESVNSLVRKAFREAVREDTAELRKHTAELRRHTDEIRRDNDEIQQAVNTLRAAVESVYREVMPNHGKSLRDAVDAIRDKLNEHVQWSNARSEQIDQALQKRQALEDEREEDHRLHKDE